MPIILYNIYFNVICINVYYRLISESDLIVKYGINIPLIYYKKHFADVSHKKFKCKIRDSNKAYS